MDRMIKKEYAEELVDLEDLENFRLEDLAAEMTSVTPRLWSLVQCLLDSDNTLSKRREYLWQKKEKRLGSKGSKSDEEEGSDNTSDNTDDKPASQSVNLMDVDDDQPGSDSCQNTNPKERRQCTA